jgi:hypothetical protein
MSPIYTPPDYDALVAEFDLWWETHGQYIRAGGGLYEKTFAFEAWRHVRENLVPVGLTLNAPTVAFQRRMLINGEQVGEWHNIHPDCVGHELQVGHQIRELVVREPRAR